MMTSGEFGMMCTTTKMILRDTAQTLMEAVTKSNCLAKCLRISEADDFFYGGYHNYPSCKNASMEADILFTEAVKIVYLVKSIIEAVKNTHLLNSIYKGGHPKRSAFEN
jgi:hypothetical protein